MFSFITKHWFKLVCTAVVIVISFILTLNHSESDLDYCKNIIRYGNGIAAINEGDFFTSIVSADLNGKITGKKITILNTNPLSITARSFSTLFTDDKGDLYVLCKVYDNKEEQSYNEVYKCNFKRGYASKEWEFSSPKGYSFAMGDIPYAENDELYVTLINNENGSTSSYAFDKDGNYRLVFENKFPDHIETEKNVYTPYGTAALTMRNGVYLGTEKIYPDNKTENGVYNGLGYDNGIISFGDIDNNRVIHYDPKAKKLTQDSIKETGFDSFQSIRFYSDSSFTASFENDELLGGVYYNGESLEKYKLFKGGFSITFFIVITVLLLAALSVLWLLNAVLFVRAGRKKRNGKKFIHVSYKITSVSLVITIMSAGIFGGNIYKNIKSMYDYKINSDNLSTAKFLANHIKSLPIMLTDTGSGIPEIDEENYSEIKNTISHYQEQITKEAYFNSFDFTVITAVDDNMYCIYSNEFTGSMPAEYAVSLRTLEYFRKVLNGKQNRTVEDKRSIGTLNYTIYYDSLTALDGKHYPIAVASVTDLYKEKLVSMGIIPIAFAAIVVLGGVLLIVVNVILRIIFIRLNKLEKALENYSTSRNYSGFYVKGQDEIAQTAMALRQMSNGLEIYINDINEGNRNYQKLISTDILRFMGKDGISKVTVGEVFKSEMVVIRFVFDSFSDINYLLKRVIGICKSYNSYILDFDREKLDVCIKPEYSWTGMAADFLESDISDEVTAYISYGEIQIGSIGNENHAYLTAASKVYEIFNMMYKHGGGKKNICVVDKVFSDELSEKVFGFERHKLYDNGTYGFFELSEHTDNQEQR